MDTLTLSLHKDYLYYASSKWLYYPERVACIKEGNFRDVMPVTVQLIPSLYCNFYCPHCCYGRSKESIKATGKRQGMLMDLPTMTGILDRIREAGIQGVVFTGGGEPTVNPYLID